MLLPSAQAQGPPLTQDLLYPASSRTSSAGGGEEIKPSKIRIEREIEAKRLIFPSHTTSLAEPEYKIIQLTLELILLIVSLSDKGKYSGAFESMKLEDKT